MTHNNIQPLIETGPDWIKVHGLGDDPTYRDRIVAAIRLALNTSAASPTSLATDEKPLTFTYRNWRGEIAVRRVIPKRVWFGITEWHGTPQWFLAAHDLDKGEDRDFALLDFTSEAAEQELAHLKERLAEAEKMGAFFEKESMETFHRLEAAAQEQDDG